MSFRTACLNGSRKLWQPPRRIFIRFNSGLYHDTLVPWFAQVRHSAAAVHTSYENLSEFMHRQNEKTLLTGSDAIECEQSVSHLLHDLTASQTFQDMQRVRQILTDMEQVFLLPPTLEHHSVILRAMPDNWHKVRHWILGVHQCPPNKPPSVEQVNEFLARFTGIVTLNRQIKTIHNLTLLGSQPNNETFLMLIRALTTEEPIGRKSWVLRIFEIIQQVHVPYDPVIAQLIESGLELPNQQSVPLVNKYEEITDRTPNHTEQESGWVFRITRASRTAGFEAALALFREYSEAGGQLSHPIAQALISHSTSIEDLDYLEQNLNFPLTPDLWAILLSNNITSRPTLLMELYNEALSRGNTLSAPLATPIIKRFSTLTGHYLDKALDIYRDLRSATSGSNDGPNAAIYRAIFEGLTSAQNSRKHDTVVGELWRDMEELQISTEDFMHYKVLIEMRKASDPQKAFDAFLELSPNLSKLGYVKVLAGFLKMKFKSEGPIPSVNIYFDIVASMRYRWFGAVNPRVYTIFLREIEGITESLVQSRTLPYYREELLRATRRAHDLLTVDASISPQPSLWNQFMRLYLRLDHFGNVCRVWDEVYLSDRFDADSVDIILKACRLNHAERLANQIQYRLTSNSYQFTKENWDGWIACLCTFARVNEAAKALCLDMGKADIDADAETLDIVLAAARRAKLESGVLTRVRTYLPKLWETLPDHVRTRINTKP